MLHTLFKGNGAALTKHQGQHKVRKPAQNQRELYAEITGFFWIKCI